MTVYFIKFRNGEEVIAEVWRNNKDLVLTEPMSLEYSQDDDNGRRMIFMTRYNPFCKDKTVRIPRSMIAYMSQVIPEVSDYYVSSLDYCKQVMDDTFKRGIGMAARQARDSLAEKKVGPVRVMDEESSGQAYSANTTLH